MLSHDEIEAMNAEARAGRVSLVALWDKEFQTHAESYIDGSIVPLDGESVTDVWVEIPRYGGIVIAVETSAGRILSPWYDQSPHDGGCCDGQCSRDEDIARDTPDEYLDMMYGATEFTYWTEYPTTGIRYWG